MANPTQGDVHVNRPLTNISVAYMQSAASFVADRVFPRVSSEKQSDLYFKYDRSDFWRSDFKKRADSTESAGSGWKISTDTYFAHVWALHKDIGDQLRSNTDNPLNLDRDASLWLASQAMISREVEWASAFFTTGVWTGYNGVAGVDITGVAASPTATDVIQWSDGSNSNPITDIRAKSTLIQLRSGYRPNKLVIGRQVWDVLAEHPDIIDRINRSSSNNNPAMVTRQAVAALFELDEILVADGIQVTSDENPSFETSMTTSFIAGKNALLVYANPTPSLLMPSGGYTFEWTGLPGSPGMGTRVSKFRIQEKKTDRVEAEMAYVHKVVCPDCGIFFNGIVA